MVNACKPGIPKNVIAPDKMELVLFDIHATDGYIGLLPRQDTAKIVASSYYKGIYAKFDIDSAKYSRSLAYYYNHPEVLNLIYENLGKKFEEERKKNDARLDKDAKEEQKKELARNAKPLVVPVGQTGPPKFNFGVNPFSFSSTAP